MWSDFETHVRPPPTPCFPTTQGLFGSPWFWVISLSFHHWVFKTRGFHQKNLVWLGFWVMFPSLKTQKFEWWMMKTENKILVFSVSEIWVMVAKKWVMWSNNNFGVFEIKWGLGYELWVLSIELWKLSHGQTKQALILTKYLPLSLGRLVKGMASFSFNFTLKHKHTHTHYFLPLSFTLSLVPIS